MIQRVPCRECGAMILPTTSKATGGLCMPCQRKQGPLMQNDSSAQGEVEPRALSADLGLRNRRHPAGWNVGYRLRLPADREPKAVAGSARCERHSRTLNSPPFSFSRARGFEPVRKGPTSSAAGVRCKRAASCHGGLVRRNYPRSGRFESGPDCSG